MSQPLLGVLPQIAVDLTRKPHVLLCFDFDGTLTPLMDDPAAVFLPPGMPGLLQALAEHPSLSVAIISGRDRADLQNRIGIPGLIYGGNHGLEISGPGFIFIEEAAVASCAGFKDLNAELAKKLQAIPGAFVEDKGLTLSVHYRQVAEEAHEEVRRQVHATLANTAYPFVLTMGNKVYEIRPRVEWNKGAAVTWIKKKLGQEDARVVYVGDDQTDEDAFAAWPEEITVKVGPTVETKANYHLETLAEVQIFLQWLTTLFRPSRA